MKKAILVLAVCWLGLVLAAGAHTYPTGVYWNLPGGYWCGLEIQPSGTARYPWLADAGA